MGKIFVPHELKTIEVDTDKKIFRVNGEDFGKGCTGFTIRCNRYDNFDIRLETESEIRFVHIDGEAVEENVISRRADPSG